MHDVYWPNSTTLVLFGQGSASEECSVPARLTAGQLLFTLQGSYTMIMPAWRNSLKTSKFFNGRKQLAQALTFLSALLLVCAATLSVNAQSGALSPYQDESDGVNAGGKWMEFHSEDKMTGAKKVRFELLSDSYLSAEPDYKPRIELVCTDGKHTYTDFNPGIRLGPPNRPGFWGQPQMEVLVRVDDSHSNHGWNWIRGRFLSVDKGTTRELIGAHVFKVEIRGRNGRPEIAEFSPGGMDLVRVKHSCDLTPKRP